MPFDLENKVNDVYQNSTTTLRCVEQGPFELSAIVPDVRNLSETLKLLSDASSPSVASFDMATREQASELWSALEACDRNLFNIRSIWSSFAELDWSEKSQFTAETSFSTGGCRYLQAKLINFSTTLKSLLVGFKVSSTSLNWPPSIDVLGQIQAELLAEGVEVDHLQARHDEIKAYVRSLAVGNEPSHVCHEPQISSPLVPMIAIPESPTTATAPPPSRHVTNLADQFSALFEPRALRRPSVVGLIAPSPTIRTSSEKSLITRTTSAKPITHSLPPAPARKDSMDLNSSLISRFSTAVANMALSNLGGKSYSIRPPPQRSSSAVFRGLGNEERATGE
ncbi:hypothetical protein D6C78_03624 [Aureobasidium pullulans]|uniref:Uncharacterized protein n=1 Tax=Aureobasidium pullulans TaxID=5580 RepID=A0A4T0C3L5_AURPU|nr:hypothetical protein D6C78_03624 [Aureobasidium pullulans]